jgi:hypothetical protein
MVASCQEPSLEQARGIAGLQGTVSNPALRRLDFDERLEPEQAARTGSDNVNGNTLLERDISDGTGHARGTDSNRGGILRNEDPCHD